MLWVSIYSASINCSTHTLATDASRLGSCSSSATTRCHRSPMACECERECECKCKCAPAISANEAGAEAEAAATAGLIPECLRRWLPPDGGGGSCGSELLHWSARGAAREPDELWG